MKRQWKEKKSRKGREIKASDQLTIENENDHGSLGDDSNNWEDADRIKNIMMRSKRAMEVYVKFRKGKEGVVSPPASDTESSIKEDEDADDHTKGQCDKTMEDSRSRSKLQRGSDCTFTDVSELKKFQE